MKKLNLKKHEVDTKKYKLRSVSHEDYDDLIKSSCLLQIDEKPIGLYLELSPDDDCSDPLHRACKNIDYHTSDRSQGLVSTSRTFGFLPRAKHRRDYCTATALAYQQPLQHKIICDAGIIIDSLYKRYLPEAWEQHNKKAQEILEYYRLPNTVFTSGIINKTTQLKYHFDTGNIKNAYSCMAVFKHDVEGGYLCLPEYRVAVECKNNSLFIFDGQSILHGVTPIRRLTTEGYRYSIVYYTLQQMANCLPPEEELNRIRKNKTERELKRLNPEHMKGLAEMLRKKGKFKSRYK